MCGIAGFAYRRAHDFRQEAERRVQTMIDVQARDGETILVLVRRVGCLVETKRVRGVEARGHLAQHPHG